MRGFRYRSFALMAVIALATWSCSSNTTTTPTTPTPTPTSVTETFSGPLTPNGAITFPFTTTAGGSVTMTLAAINPDSGLTIGIALGTLAGTTCHLVLTNDGAVQGSFMVATSGSAGSYCARIYDAGGVVTTAQTVSVTVVHF